MDTKQIEKYATTVAIIVIVMVVALNWNTFRGWVHLEPIPETA